MVHLDKHNAEARRVYAEAVRREGLTEYSSGFAREEARRSAEAAVREYWAGLPDDVKLAINAEREAIEAARVAARDAHRALYLRALSAYRELQLSRRPMSDIPFPYDHDSDKRLGEIERACCVRLSLAVAA